MRAMLLILGVFIGSVAQAAPPASDPYSPGRELIAGLEKIVTPNGIDETFQVSLGGVPQVVNVRGADRANPILLFIHGGPASPEMPLAWSFQRPWEDFFTVVQWDQRGSGRSFAIEDSAKVMPTLSVAAYVEDTIELIDTLRARYGKRKVFLLGLSFGSAVGLYVARQRPDLLYAYLGVGQLISGGENEHAGLKWTLAQARADHNQKAIAALDALDAFPNEAPISVERTMIEREWNIHYGGLVAGRGDADFYFHLGRLSPLYTPDDRKAWDAGSEATMKAVWTSLTAIDFRAYDRFDIPLFFFLGRHDYTTPSPIAAQWLERVKAPAKRVFWFENSAHLPFIEEPGRMLQALLEVRPLADLPHARH